MSIYFITGIVVSIFVHAMGIRLITAYLEDVLIKIRFKRINNLERH